MRWEDGRRSDNVEDRRGMGGGGAALGGGAVLVIAVIAMLFGVDPRALLQQVQSGSAVSVGQQAGPAQTSDPAGDREAQFVAVVLAETEDVWHQQLQARGVEYREPHLVLFSDQAQSACGFASAAVGPFYCPEDERVYLDLGFFREMRQRFGASGDFAEAYVIAHEVGHHVQNLLGITQKVSGMRGRLSETEYNRLSVRLELQADFLAGVWAHHTQKMKQLLEQGDIEEALNAASAIGDDKLQMQSQGYEVPDGFTHGTSEQRARWFRKGYETGDIAHGDTFNAPVL